MRLRITMNCIKMTYKGLRTGALLFLLLPVLLFLLFFVKPIIGIPAAVGMLVAYLTAIRERTEKSQTIEIPFRRLFVFFVICAVWCYLGGQGGLFYQTSDWNERNAIFRDLITEDWPVYYPATNTMLTYYIGHWLPAASIGRVIYLSTQNVDVAFNIGNILLAIWTLFGVFTTFLLHLCTVRTSGFKGQWLILLLFIGFSGMDVIGCKIMKWTMNDMLRIQHLEWWNTLYQFTSNTSCLFWVFNQAITAWIATLCFVNESNNRNYAMIIGCSLLSATLPCVGLALLMIGKVVIDAISSLKKKNLLVYIKKTFSISNVLTIVCWLPVIATYLLSNSALEKTVEGNSTEAVLKITERMQNYSLIVIGFVGVALLTHIVSRIVIKSKQTPFFLGAALLLAVTVAMLYIFPETGILYYLFLALECGIYWVFLANNYHRDPMYYLIALPLIISPCIRVGISADFCMRASLPALTVLMSMCGNKLIGYFESGKHEKRTLWTSVSSLLLIFCLLIGMATPAMEFYRGFVSVKQENKLALTADSIYTLNQYHSSGGIYGNFVSDTYSNSLFFKYFSRKS